MKGVLDPNQVNYRPFGTYILSGDNDTLKHEDPQHSFDMLAVTLRKAQSRLKSAQNVIEEHRMQRYRLAADRTFQWYTGGQCSSAWLREAHTPTEHLTLLKLHNLERQLGEQPVPAATRPGNGHSSRPSETEYRTALPADLSELIETEVKSKKLFRKGQFVYRYHTALYSGFVMVTILALISFFSLMIQPIINSKSSCSSLFDKLVLVVYLLDYLTSPLGWIGGCKRKQQPVRRYHTQKHSVQSMRQDPQKLKDDTWADFMHQLRFAMCFSWVASCVAMWHQHSFNSIAQLMHCTVLLAFLKEFAVWSLLSG